jgi:predicted ATPase/DNA-binding XRE family transcriptional regulator
VSNKKMPVAEINDRPTFGKQLRALRREAGLSQEALAERALMSVDTISALERGTSQAPQRETLASLVKALDLDPEQQQSLEALAVRPSRPRSYAHDRTQRHNLPHASTQLYGRASESEALSKMIRNTRLVTLTGAGGVGKTTLAQHVGRELLDDFPDGIWFVDLAPHNNPQIAAKTLAALFDVRESSGRDLVEQLALTLQRKHLLVILDNCEHLIELIAECVQSLIQACPKVHVLATSRHVLNVQGEHTYRVSSLDIDAATALFLEHARRVSARFEVTEENAEVIGGIVLALDGIPLAIELAAARLNILSPNQLAERLSDRFRVLTGGSQEKLPRQQTMRATIDWSYNLLTADEQKVFRRLAVFRSSFSLDAANAVCTDAEIGEWCALDLLASLVDKSLLISELVGTEHRYRLFESVRAYAREKIGDEAQSLHRRHAEFYLRLSERAGADLDRELENFRSALDWAIGEDGDTLVGARLLTALQEVWIERGLAMEAARRAQILLQGDNVLPQHLRAALWLTLTRGENEFQAPPQVVLEAATQARNLSETSGDRRDLATALRMQGIARARLGALAEAEADLQRSLEIFREIGDLREIARALGSLGYLYQTRGDFALAHTATIEMLQLTRAVGDTRNSALAATNLAETEFALGDVQRAAERALSNLMQEEGMTKTMRATQQANLAVYLLALDKPDDARSMALASVAESDTDYAAIPLQHLAAILAPSHPESAARMLGYVEKVFAATPYMRQRTEQYTYDRLIATLRDTLDDDEIAQLGRQGAAMNEEQVLNLARHPEVRASHRRRDIRDAVVL